MTDIKDKVTAAADQAKAALSDAATKEVASAKSALTGQIAKVEAEVKGKFQSFLANNPKKLIVVALLIGLVAGLFFGAVAGVKLATANVSTVGDTSESGGEQQATAQQGWFEFTPWSGNASAQGNG